MKINNFNLNCFFKGVLSFLITFFFLTSITFSQTEEQQKILRDFAEHKSVEYYHKKREADSLAKLYGIAIRGETPGGAIYELQYFENGHPVYYITNNLNAAKTVSTDKVWPGGGAGLNLTGQGEILGIWDEGKVKTTHQELTGRVTQVDNPSSLNNHSTHVAGTMIASGIDLLAKGMAYEANLHAFDWNNDISEMATEANGSLLVSNHSYGLLAGWEWGDWATPGTEKWHWFGNPAISPVEDYAFGFYDSKASSYDSIAFNAPKYLIVKSAGNDRDNNPGLQPIIHYVWNNGQWVLSNNIRDKDGGNDGYDCIPTNGVAKNILTIGAVNDIPNGYTQPADVIMTSFSGWGPTDDGRIKPDLVADGRLLYSCISSTNTSYDNYSGTSMATPNVSGSIALLNQHYKNTHGNAILRSATIKALVIHSADEAGPDDGPDYMFGWGLMNTEKAAQIITDDSNDGQGTHIRELTLHDNQTIELRIWPNGIDPLKVTLVWTDPAGTPPANWLNSANKMLVNDLNLTIIDNLSSAVFHPYRLDPANPNNPATNAQNSLDNVEQVVFTPVGQCPRYTVKITHLGALANNHQEFSLIISGNQSNTIYVKWDAIGLNNGTSWANAYADLHNAITMTPAGWDIWVAKGTYSPTGNGIGRSRHFKLKDCVEIYGGFEGTENPNIFDLYERNLLTNETILDGENDRYNVFNNAGIDETALLDGFTITRGRADDVVMDGAGMYNFASSPRIENCRFIRNCAIGNGAGMCNSGSSPKISNCVFSGNGIIMPPILLPPECGGGMCNNGSSPEITNCIFSGNQAVHGGGLCNLGGSPLITNSTISGNLALYEGGGIFIPYSPANLDVVNSIIWGNSVRYESQPNEYHGHQIYCGYPGQNPIIDLEHTCIETGGNHNLYGDGTINIGIGCITIDPLFIAPEPALAAPTTAGDYRLQLASPAIDAGNNWPILFGVINKDIDWNPRISNNTVDMGVYEFPYPFADFTFTEVCEGNATNFTDASWIAAGIIVQWFWDFGDLGMAFGQNPNHIYGASGIYTVTLTVTSDGGCTGTVQHDVNVYPTPVADAGPDVTICEGDCTTLTASGGLTYIWSTGEITASINVCSAVTTTYGVTVTDLNGCTASDDVTVSVTPCGTPVKVKTLLQCPYAGSGLMNTNLQGILPNDQPYNRAPWFYNGNETLNSIPVNMVDWILVELRDASDSSLIIAQRAALLLDDGNIADTNLASSVNFDGVSAGNYYLCLHHCNHMPVMSANPIPIPNSTLYDFSDPVSSPPFGGISQALIELEPGVYGMIGGDINSDGILKYSGPSNDRALILQLIVNESGSSSITTTINGYYAEDANMDATVKYSGSGNDPLIIIQNLINLTGSASITTIFISPVPHGVKSNP